MKKEDVDTYERDNLSKDYEEELQAKKYNFIKEREQRIQKEQEELFREKKRMEIESIMERERKDQLKKIQYQEYLEGLKKRENKIQKELEEKLTPMGVSLPMNSDERLKSYHNKVYKLSDRADRNRKLFMAYNEKSKSDKYYNYLSKRYTMNKEINTTIPNNKDIPMNQLYQEDNYLNKNINDIDEGYKNQTFNNYGNNNLNNLYNNSYNKYKNLYREYNDFNKILAEQNNKRKEFLTKQRLMQEEKRIEESQKLSELRKQEKLYENERKKLYKDYLDKQIQDQIPIKFSKENYNQITDNQINFKNNELYDSIPHYSTLNKNRFVEVNPYCCKNYDLGKSNLESNPILNPMFNYNYNKYLFKNDSIPRTTLPIMQGYKNPNTVIEPDYNSNSYDNNKNPEQDYLNRQMNN